MIFVTASHIEKAKGRLSRFTEPFHHNLHNPIAIALQERDACAVVTPTRVHSVQYIAPLPDYAKRWLADFASGREVGPLNLTI